MSFKNRYNVSAQVKGAIIASALVFLKELGVLGLRELSEALEQYYKEKKTPDGWTRDEYLNYAIGRLNVIKNEAYGPFYIDYMFDTLLQWLIDDLMERLDKEEEEEDPIPPVIDPPVVDPEPIPGIEMYWKVLSAHDYEQLEKLGLVEGATVYRHETQAKYFVTTPGIGAPIPEGFVKIKQVPFK